MSEPRLFDRSTDQQEQRGNNKVAWRNGFVPEAQTPGHGYYQKLSNNDEQYENRLPAINANSTVQRNPKSKSSGEQHIWRQAWADVEADMLAEDMFATPPRRTVQRGLHELKHTAASML